MWTRFEGVIHAYSPKAIFFQSWYWEEGLWLPASQIRWYADGELTYVIEMRDWLADKNGLLEFTQYSAQHMESLRA